MTRIDRLITALLSSACFYERNGFKPEEVALKFIPPLVKMMGQPEFSPNLNAPNSSTLLGFRIIEDVTLPDGVIALVDADGTLLKSWWY